MSLSIRILKNRLNKLQDLLEEMPFEPHRMRVGAMTLDNKGRILSIGFNSYTKSHPLMYTNRYFDGHKIYLHAEVDALVKARNKGVTARYMIIARIGAKGDLKLAKPCIRCMYQLALSELDSVYYTNDQGNLILFTGE